MSDDEKTLKATKKGKCIKKGVSHFFASFPVKNQQFLTGYEAPAKPQTCAKQLIDRLPGETAGAITC